MQKKTKKQSCKVCFELSKDLAAAQSEIESLKAKIFELQKILSHSNRYQEKSPFDSGLL